MHDARNVSLGEDARETYQGNSQSRGGPAQCPADSTPFARTLTSPWSWTSMLISFCAHLGSAIWLAGFPLDRIHSHSTNVMGKACHPERREGSPPATPRAEMLHFATAPFRMTVITPSGAEYSAQPDHRDCRWRPDGYQNLAGFE